jgi:hypothetical protein
MKKLHLYISFLALFSSLLLGAQEIKFSGTVSKTKVSVGERFQLSYSINTNASTFNGPDLSAFDVYTGPNQTFTTNYVNGQLTQSLTYYYHLSARKPGKISIGAARINVGGRTLQSNTLELEVSNASQPANQGQHKQGNTTGAASNGQGNNLFIRAHISKSTAFLGEPVTVIYKVYNRYPMVNFSDVKIPSFNGFYTEEIALDKNGKGVSETVGGIQYTTLEIKRTLLIPQKTGKLEIPTLDASFIVRERVAPQSIFDQILGGSYRDTEVKVKSIPLSIEVLPLPLAGKPTDFTGGVGQFSFDVSSSTTKLKAGDAFNLNLKIQGKGNIKLIDPPKINVPSEIELYDPQIKDAAQVSSGGMSGSKSFDYLMIPQAGGTYEIGPFQFTYFDPQKKSYQTISSAAIRLEVEKSAGEQPASNRSGSATGTKVIASDIRYNKTLVKAYTPLNEQGFLFSMGYFVWALLPLLAFIGLLLYKRYQQNRFANRSLYKTRDAGHLARKRLQRAHELKSSGNNDAFYEEIFKALYGYLGDKFQIAVANLSRDVIRQKLTEHQTDTELQNKLFKVLDTCEMARYAPSAVQGMHEVYHDTTEVITGLEKR